ncbi:MAG: hypothetical protein PHN31_06885, partial [Candidatus Gracilibacteria bacterium]|nr:hypothetical protein [Candidatus Gracilibacteria bacterium]
MRNKILGILLILFLMSKGSVLYCENIEENNIGQETLQEEVSTINIYNPKISEQKDNNIKLHFEISNQNYIQPGIKYSVQLLKIDDDGFQSWVDETVYQENISLNENTTIYKDINYIAPDYLKGKYQIFIMLKNNNGATLALGTPGDIILNGDDKYVQIEEETCYLSVEGEKGLSYTISQGIDITDKEKLIATCEIKNKTDSDTIFIPQIKTYWRSSFGDNIDTKEIKETKYELKKGERKEISILLPQVKVPQSYDAQLQLLNENNKIISNKVSFHYVVNGLSATIQNLRLDKDYYKENDIAKVSFFWSGPADNFLGTRNNSTKNKEIYLNLSIKNKDGKDCIKKEQILLDENSNTKNYEIPVIKECKDFKISVSLTDKNGEELDSKKYDIKTTSIGEKEKNNGIILTMLLTILVLFLILILTIKFQRKHGKYGKHLNTIIIVILIGGILFAKQEKVLAAYTYNYGVRPQYDNGAYTEHSILATIGLNKTKFLPGESITGNMTIANNGCLNSFLDYDLSTTLKSGATKTITGGNGTRLGDPRLISYTTTAPTTPGNYVATFTFRDNRCYSSSLNGMQAAIDSCGNAATCNYLKESEPKSIYIISKTSKLNAQNAPPLGTSWTDRDTYVALVNYGGVYKHYKAYHIVENVTASKASCDSRAYAGNTWSISYTVVAPPTISDDYAYDNIWTKGISKTINLLPKDLYSGIKTTKWCEGVSCNPSTGIVGTSIVKNSNYNNTIRYQTWNNDGLSSTVGTVVVKLDNNTPTVSATNSSTTWRKANTTITLYATDTGGSGISQAR